MNQMTKAEMIDFLRGMNRKQKILVAEKKQIIGNVESLEDAIRRNTFSKPDDESGVTSSGFSSDKVFRILLNSHRDVEEQTRSMVMRMRDIYEQEDQLDFVRHCLMQMSAREQYLITETYINDRLIDSTSKMMGFSRSYLYRLLQKAIDQLLDIYNKSCNEASSSKADRLIQEVIPYMPEGSLV